MQFDWEAMVGTFISGSLAIGVAKYFLSSTLTRFEAIPEKLENINVRLSAITVKIENLDKSLEKMQGNLQDHDRKIIAIELRGPRVSPRRADPSCKA